MGILAVPPDGDIPTYDSFIQANYVKYLEMGGARVVPILFDNSRE